MNALPVITLCPAGTVHVASSRLRCHVLARELARLGCPVHVGLQPGVVPDVLYVQKLVTPEILAVAQQVKQRGGQVIFDIDDFGDALSWVRAEPALFAEFLALCAVVSVDTDVRRDVFAKDAQYQGIPQFWVIPDPIDYVDAEVPTPAAPARAATAGLDGCWFGNGPNVKPAVPYMAAALQTGRLARFGVITNAGLVPQLQATWPMLAVEAWQLDTFADRLRQSDFCLLIHDTNIEGVQKSNNKMLAALGLGVVPLVSNTPAYAQTAHQIGIPELLINRPEDLAELLQGERLQQLRERVRGPACQQALAGFMPASVAQDFLNKVIQLQATPQSASPAVVAPAAAPIRLNLGCGDMLLPGYVNVDVAMERAGKQPDVCCDVRNLSAFPDNHADEVMAIHVIEHFYRWEVVDLLKEWVRVLKPGGKLVLECPNLLAACEALIKNPEMAARPDQAGNRTMWCFYGDPGWKDPLMCHRWLYTPQSLAQVMAEAGLGELSQQPALFKVREPRDMRIVGVKPLKVAAAVPAEQQPQAGALPRQLFNVADVIVTENTVGQETVRDLWFGPTPKFRQSSFLPERPAYMALEYTRTLMASLLLQPAPRRALVLGLGGGAVPRALKHLRGDQIEVDVVDVKQEVFYVAHKYFGMERLADYNFYLCDAQEYVRRCSKSYDLIVVDVWDEEGVPGWMLTPSFWAGVRRIAGDDAVVCTNAPMVIAPQLVERFTQAFPTHCVVGQQNLALFGSTSAELSAAQLQARAGQLQASLLELGVQIEPLAQGMSATLVSTAPVDAR
jgi:ubiquinone/menaquinone biosynthesis C-methylase UbiE